MYKRQVINNHVLGMVRQWQTLFYGKRYSNTVLNDAVDFVKISEGMGAKAYLSLIHISAWGLTQVYELG